MRTRAGKPVRYSVKKRLTKTETLHSFHVGNEQPYRFEHGVRRLRELTLDLRQMLGMEAARD
jgi:hypothetical protein